MKALFCLSLPFTTALIVLVACESDERAAIEQAKEPPSPEASIPEAAAPSSDAVVSEAGVDAASEPVVCEVMPCAVELAAGQAHFCARMNDGTVRCWGDDTAGALGRGDVDASDGGASDGGAALPVVDLADVVQISAARGTTCARGGDGAVRCWGSNADGKLGLAEEPAIVDLTRHATPARVAGGRVFTRVDVGARNACAITVGGEVVCWGANDQQQLARDGARSGAFGPAIAEVPGAIMRTSSTPSTSYALTADGGVLTWGAVAGPLSVSGREASISPDPSPALIYALRGVTGFAAGEKHACAIVAGEVMCWGGFHAPPEPIFGALCTGPSAGEMLPVRARIDGTSYAQQIATAKETTCARLANGEIRCCGTNDKGQLGTGDAGALARVFVPASAFTGYAVAVATAANATCALLRNGAVECWGGNDRGQLGRGSVDTDPHPVPQRVAF